MDSPHRATDEEEEKFPVHTLVSITTAPNTRLVCFHLHKPTPARPFGKHGTLTSAQFFLPPAEQQCICCGLNRASVPLSREFVRK